MATPSPEEPRQLITGIHGIVLIAENYSEQIAFYRDVLGLKLTTAYSDAAFFEIGSQVLAIFARGHHPEGDRALQGASHGLSHLEFSIPACDVAEMENRLRDSVAEPGRKHFKDADGTIFHFVT